MTRSRMLTEREIKTYMNARRGNPYHGPDGKFTTGAGASTTTYTPKSSKESKLSNESMSQGKGYWEDKETLDKTKTFILDDYDSINRSYTDPVYMTHDEITDEMEKRGKTRDDLEKVKSLDECGEIIGTENAKQYLHEAEYTLAAKKAKEIYQKREDLLESYGTPSNSPENNAEKFAEDFKLDFGKAEREGYRIAEENTEIFGPDYEDNYELAFEAGMWKNLYNQCREKCLISEEAEK